jgi:hypothetical protein
MSGLGLVPNKVVGYRIKPDWYNFTVVVVKQFGATSKKCGQEYEEALAYCKSLESAVDWLIEHVTRIEGEARQEQQHAIDGSVAAANAMLAAIEQAKAAAHAAVADLDARLRAAGLDTPKQVVHFMGGETPDGAPGDEPGAA